MWFAWMFACSGGEEVVEPTTPTTDTEVVEVEGLEVVSLSTRDDLTLEADYYGAPPGGPGLCLFHMVPPSNDRTNWPPDFAASLQAEGWGVLVVDRRGAGGSEGDPTDAYTGPSGKYDVEACATFLADHGHSSLAILGASNGTTSMLDYTVWAGGEGLPVPVALVFMTGGSYTESQNPMTALPAIPSAFTFSTAERQWSVAQELLDPGTWQFFEYPTGDHGTRMFSAAPAVRDDLLTFLRAHL